MKNLFRLCIVCVVLCSFVFASLPCLANMAENYGTIAENSGGENMHYNFGTVNINNGTIESNYKAHGGDGTVVTNNGLIWQNGSSSGSGTVTTNFGTINMNYEGTITTNVGTVLDNTDLVVSNNGIVQTNEGTITNNNNEVQSNYHGGTILTNSANGVVKANGGTITTNNGKVESNCEAAAVISVNFGIVENNDGTVEINQGTVKSNRNKVLSNCSNGIIETNSATISDNAGTVNMNTSGEIKNTGHGVVENNLGTVTNTEYGSVKENNATVNNLSANATVSENNGTVNNNAGVVEDNYATVKNDTGTTTNNYGTVIVDTTKGALDSFVVNNRGTVKTQLGDEYYCYFISSGVENNGEEYLLYNNPYTPANTVIDLTNFSRPVSFDSSRNPVCDPDCYVIGYKTSDGTEYPVPADGKITIGYPEKITLLFFKPDAAIENPPVAIDGLRENGKDQVLISAGVASKGELLYSLDNTNWSKSLPKGNVAGLYTVYYKAVGDAYVESDVSYIHVPIGIQIQKDSDKKDTPYKKSPKTNDIASKAVLFTIIALCGMTLNSKKRKNDF